MPAMIMWNGVSSFLVFNTVESFSYNVYDPVSNHEDVTGQIPQRSPLKFQRRALLEESLPRQDFLQEARRGNFRIILQEPRLVSAFSQERHSKLSQRPR